MPNEPFSDCCNAPIIPAYFCSIGWYICLQCHAYCDVVGGTAERDNKRREPKMDLLEVFDACSPAKQTALS